MPFSITSFGLDSMNNQKCPNSMNKKVSASNWMFFPGGGESKPFGKGRKIFWQESIKRNNWIDIKTLSM